MSNGTALTPEHERLLHVLTGRLKSIFLDVQGGTGFGEFRLHGFCANHNVESVECGHKELIKTKVDLKSVGV